VVWANSLTTLASFLASYLLVCPGRFRSGGADRVQPLE
jgi:hypothetical protein